MKAKLRERKTFITEINNKKLNLVFKVWYKINESLNVKNKKIITIINNTRLYYN